MAEIYKLNIDGSTVWPATSTNAVLDSDSHIPLPNLLKTWNITLGWPDENIKTLPTALNFLASHLPSSRKILGTRVEFVNAEGELEAWEWLGGENLVFEDPAGWNKCGGELMKDLENAVLPLTLSYTLSPKVIERQVATGVTITLKVTKGEKDVTSECDILFNSEKLTTPSKTINLNQPTATTLEYPVVVTRLGETLEGVVRIPVVNAVYFGTAPKGTPTAATIQALPKFITEPGEDLEATMTWENKVLILAQPSTTAAPKFLIDDSGINYLPGMSTTTVTVGGVTYSVWYQPEPCWISKNKTFKVIY